jgi:alkaline phosphatase D
VNRRRFLGGLVAAAAIAPARRAHAATLSFGPASFDVTATSALVWLRAAAGARVRLEYGTSAELDGATLTAPVVATEATDYTVVSDLTDLAPDTPYYYRGLVSSDDGEWVKGPIGRFRTAPASPREFRFAWSGDMEAGHRPFALFDHVTAQAPDFFLMVGDTMYADVPKERFVASLAHYRSKHRENRADGPLQRMLAALPVTAIWDDHEVQNDFDRTHSAQADGRRAFREYWPIRTADTLYRRFTWTPAADVFVLDCRSSRSPNRETDGPAKTMLGATQKAWLKEALRASSAIFKFVVSSVPFLPAGRQDSWAGFQTERRELVEFIRNETIRNVVVLSADIHMAYDFEGEGLQQFVAGPIAAWVHCRGANRAALRQAFERLGRPFVCDANNFGLIAVRPEATPPDIEVRFVDAAGVVRHRRVIPAV